MSDSRSESLPADKEDDDEDVRGNGGQVRAWRVPPWLLCHLWPVTSVLLLQLLRNLHLAGFLHRHILFDHLTVLSARHRLQRSHGCQFDLATPE